MRALIDDMMMSFKMKRKTPKTIKSREFDHKILSLLRLHKITLFSCVTIFRPHGVAAISPSMALSAEFTSLITPSYYIPIMQYYRLQSRAIVLMFCQVRAGTLKHTPLYTQILSPTLYHTTFVQLLDFSPDMSFI